MKNSKVSLRSICPITKSEEKRKEALKQTDPIKNNFPKGISQPALRALANAGFTKLDDLTKVKEEDLLKLHGMGPKAIRVIKKALNETGKSFPN